MFADASILQFAHGSGCLLGIQWLTRPNADLERLKDMVTRCATSSFLSSMHKLQPDVGRRYTMAQAEAPAPVRHVDETATGMQVLGRTQRKVELAP